MLPERSTASQHPSSPGLGTVRQKRPGANLTAPLSGITVTSLKESQLTLDVMGKQIQFLLDTVVTYSVLPAFAGKPSSRTTIFTGAEGQPFYSTTDLPI